MNVLGRGVFQSDIIENVSETQFQGLCFFEESPRLVEQFARRNEHICSPQSEGIGERMTRRRILIIAALLLSLCSPVYSELRLCGGVWTNADCLPDKESQVKTMEEKPAPSLSPEEVRRKEVNRWLTPLLGKVLAANRRFDLSLSINPLKELCSLEETSKQDCLIEIGKYSAHVDREVREAKKAHLLAEKEGGAKPNPSGSKQIEQNTTVVTVIPTPERNIHGDSGRRWCFENPIRCQALRDRKSREKESKSRPTSSPQASPKPKRSQGIGRMYRQNSSELKS